MEDSRGDLGVWIESSMYNLLQEEGVNQEKVLRKINCKSVFLYLSQKCWESIKIQTILNRSPFFVTCWVSIRHVYVK